MLWKKQYKLYSRGEAQKIDMVFRMNYVLLVLSMAPIFFKKYSSKKIQTADNQTLCSLRIKTLRRNNRETEGTLECSFPSC